MRGFLTIAINDDGKPPDLQLNNGGKPFTYVEILGALQQTQFIVLKLMEQEGQKQEAKAEVDKGDKKRPGEKHTS